MTLCDNRLAQLLKNPCRARVHTQARYRATETSAKSGWTMEVSVCPSCARAMQRYVEEGQRRGHDTVVTLEKLRVSPGT